MIKDKIIGKKCGENAVSLYDHSIQTFNKAVELVKMITDDPRTISLTALSALFHDIGKATEGFQKHLYDNNFNNYIPHNILSASIIAKKLSISNNENGRPTQIIIKSILYHHPTLFHKIGQETINYKILKDRYSITDMDEKNILDIYNDLLDEYRKYNFHFKINKTDAPNSSNVDFSYFSKDSYDVELEDHTFFIVNNAVKFADLIVSNGKDYDKYINKEYDQDIVFNRPLGYDDRFEQQVSIADNLFKYKMSVFDGQTGFGKTMIGIKYLLNDNKKGYWICPRNSIAEGIYDTICKELTALQLSDKIKVGLLLTNEWKKGTPDADIIVTNIDNFIRPSLKADSNTYSYNMLYCNCIFDEFHEFLDDEAIMAAFMIVLRARYRLKNSKTILFSATPIHYFYNEFKDNANFKYYHFEYDPILNRKIKFTYGNNISSDHLNGKNYFVSVNTVKKAQSLFTNSKILDNIIHSRYTSNDLRERFDQLNIEHGKGKNKLTSWVGTNIISTGIDVSFNNMIVSWPTPERFIQAGGRCNRWDECIETPVWHIVKDEKDYNEKLGINTITTQDIARDFYNFLCANIENGSIITLRDIYNIRDKFYKVYEKKLSNFFYKTLQNSFINLSSLSYEYSNHNYDDNFKYVSNKPSLRKSNGIISFFFKVKDISTNDFIEEPMQGDNIILNIDTLRSNESLKCTYKAIKNINYKPYFSNKYKMESLKKNNSKFFEVLLDMAKCSNTPLLIGNNYFYDKKIGLFKA